MQVCNNSVFLDQSTLERFPTSMSLIVTTFVTKADQVGAIASIGELPFAAAPTVAAIASSAKTRLRVSHVLVASMLVAQCFA